MTFPLKTPPPVSMKAAPWMTPGASRVQKPSWLRMAAVSEAVEAVPSAPPVMPSVPPPASFRQPSLPPPPSSRGRQLAAQIQTTRELELESEVVQLHNELQRVVSESESMKARVMEESEPAIVSLALAIAKRVIGRELAADPTLVHAWIREAQGLMPKGDVFVAADVEGIEGAETDVLLAPGTAEIRDGASMIEVSADARIAAMADALGVDQ